MGYALQSIADVSNRQGNYDLAIDYVQRGIEAFKKIGDNRGLGYCYYTLAQVYASQKNLPLALEMHQKALEIRRHIQDKGNIASSLGHVATILFLQQRHEEAQTTAVQAKNLFKESNDLRGVANMLNLLAQIDLAANRYDFAIDLANNALMTAQKSGNIEYMKNAYTNLFLAYQGKKDVEQAYKYQKLLIVYQDSLFSQERTRQSLDLQTQYEQGKQKLAIELLEQETQKRSYMTYGIAGVLLLVVAFLFLGVRNMRIRKRNHAQLLTQQQEITVKNEQLTTVFDEIRKKEHNIHQGILYAKRIQGALLLPENELQQYFAESFILFKPRDVVSGDFYWFAEKTFVTTTNLVNQQNKFAKAVPTEGKTLLIAVADCTGHGVPGAFMSMIGDSLLNQIVHDQEIHRPDLILNELTKGIRTALNQEETEQNDGMDISIVAVHKNTSNEVVRIGFAGAMNPSYLVKNLNNNPELLTLQADKMPIGGSSHLYKRKNTRTGTVTSFTKHSIIVNHSPIDLPTNSPEILEEAKVAFGHEVTAETLHFVHTPCVLYVCSDGFQDQFGGEDNRKFMVGKLKKTFVAHANASIADQRNIYDKTFEDWKGNYKQTDDVCVIGIKIT
jgi:tetratricopeptide (TPR) repeat protein